MHQEQFEVNALDEGAAIPLDLPWLSSETEEPEESPASEEEDQTRAAAEPAEPAATETEPLPDADQSVEPASSEAPMAESLLAAEVSPAALKSAGGASAEEEPVVTPPSPSLDESAKSPIMKGSPEREES
jgi:hypothetical protein